MSIDLAALMEPSWRDVLANEFAKPYLAELAAFLAKEREAQTVYPPLDDVFAAFRLTPFERVRVLLLGQDPYHGEGQAHGLAFSVPPGVAPPPSLKNMFRELKADLGIAPPGNGNLAAWAGNGVMLLNTVLTVRAGEAASHAGKGWEQLTDAVIDRLNARETPVVFLLWGGFAKKKAKRIDTSRHAIVESGHPSPLSVRHFRDTKPYSRVNAELERLGQPPIDWQIPDA